MTNIFDVNIYKHDFESLCSIFKFYILHFTEFLSKTTPFDRLMVE